METTIKSAALDLTNDGIATLINEMGTNEYDLDLDLAKEEIARLIKEGCTSGMLNDEDSEARINWKLTIDVCYQ